MNLLFLVPQLPHPPRQGTAIRNWGLIKSLSARHRLTLLTFAEPDAALSPELRAACRRIETVPPPRRTLAARLWQLAASPLPDLAHRLASRALAGRLAALLQSETFDAVFCEGLELAPFLFTTETTERTEKSNKDSVRLVFSVVRIFDAHNCETMLQSRAFESDVRQPRRWPTALYSLIQSRRLARYETQVCQSAQRVLCVSGEDAAALRSLWPGVDPVLVPNGIFLDEYGSDFQPQNSKFKIQNSKLQLVFTGKMDYRPNVDAAVWFARD
ncbi:MAG: glycosyltransferase, partial [Chloroflexi bacterium]|nr:glycosyltransferase [Chloroflexota bacterium]